MSFLDCCFPRHSQRSNDEDSNNPHHVLIDVSQGGEMRIPVYKRVPRNECLLLALAWEQQDWPRLVRQAQRHRHQVFCATENSGRTALHLACMNHGCPRFAAEELLKINRHCVVVQDDFFYTPLHLICLFRGTSGDEQLVSIFCDTAIMVEQELRGKGRIPNPVGTSPLFLAAKRSAPLQTLQSLLQTRRSRPLGTWIAPSTGGEPYWNSDTLDEYSSPLEVLVRSSREILEQVADEQIPSLRMAAAAIFDQRGKTATPKVNKPRLVESNDKATSLWQKCILLLQEDCPTLGNTGDYGILHAVACLKVPVPSLLQLAIRVYPDQAIVRDQRGMLPLDHVIKAQHPYATKSLLRALLTLPEAARCTRRGQTCLQAALEVGPMEWDNGLQDLVMAAPEYLLVPNECQLYPFAIAASQSARLDTIVSLLTACPEALLNQIKDLTTTMEEGNFVVGQSPLL